VGNNLNLGKAIADLRRAKGMTQDELSTKAGISYSTLAKLERNAISAPSVFTMADIARVLEVSIDEIINPQKLDAHKDSIDQEIKFVYCDVNGVLVRFFYRAFSKISADTGVNVDRIETVFWHYNDAANRGDISIEEFEKAVETRLGIKTGSIDWENLYMNSVEPIQSMHECLRSISENTKIGLLSDSFFGFIQKMIDRGLLPNINYSAIVESAAVHAKKPDQKIYEIAEEMAKTPGSNIFFIDDSRANLMAAEKRGWRVLWFDDYHPEESVKRVTEALSSS
jgi:transcriptional regulator with XRE-family HTH domain